MRALTEELHTVKARALRLLHPNSTHTEREALSPSTVPAGEGGERQDDTRRRAGEAGLALGGADAESDGHDIGRDAAEADAGTEVDLQQFMRDISAERGAWRLMPAAEQPGMPSPQVPPHPPHDAPLHELAEKVDRLVEKHQGHSHAEQHTRELFLGSAPQAPRVPVVRAGHIKTAAEMFIEERLGNVNNIDASVLVHRGWGDVEERRRAAVEGGTQAHPLLTTSPRPPAALQGRREVASSSGGEGPKAREDHGAITRRGYDSDAVDGYLAQNSRTALSLNSQVSMLAHSHCCRGGAQSGAAAGHASVFSVLTRNQ